MNLDSEIIGAILGTFWSIAVIAGLGDIIREDGWGLALFVGVFLVVVGLLPALLFYVWARYADREKVRPAGAPGAPVGAWQPPAKGASGQPHPSKARSWAIRPRPPEHPWRIPTDASIRGGDPVTRSPNRSRTGTGHQS